MFRDPQVVARTTQKGCSFFSLFFHGSNLATQWGSFGSFGLLSVYPDFWNQKIAQRLIEAVMEHFTQSGIQQAALFTFSNSPKHHAL
ncbi:GNAT family N-acetyltransferase [Hassallia byssoidea VB512170]|uniref:GNAT family N-acetyltransferase n=1 Tax=Hassallia byssoidea VB512170 TaxID=1304833 RepID=A0A846H341_9CYAN|nr:GNAT family N-acetyltransferase [Hassalia byssoidea]NEU71533.1 GNAT family N-acetyltransferase [Hassalia byssoidea VB512170]